MICRSLEGGEGFCDFDLDLEEADWICTSKKIFSFVQVIWKLSFLYLHSFCFAIFFSFFDLGWEGGGVDLHLKEDSLKGGRGGAGRDAVWFSATILKTYSQSRKIYQLHAGFIYSEIGARPFPLWLWFWKRQYRAIFGCLWTQTNKIMLWKFSCKCNISLILLYRC